MRFLRGSLQNYFPIAGTETKFTILHTSSFLAFRITSPLRGLKRFLFFSQHENYLLQNYFPIAGTETMLQICYETLLIKLQNYFPIAGTETCRIHTSLSLIPLQNYFPIAGTETIWICLQLIPFVLQNYFPIAGTETERISHNWW